jgi:hypothetical protein
MDEGLEVKALVLFKGEDRYYFLYTPEDTDALVESLIDTALDASLNLGWNEVVYLLREHGLAPDLEGGELEGGELGAGEFGAGEFGAGEFGAGEFGAGDGLAGS